MVLIHCVDFRLKLGELKNKKGYLQKMVERATFRSKGVGSDLCNIG